MTERREGDVVPEIQFEYRENFDPSRARQMLGLDGYSARRLSPQEKVRLANLLLRNEFLTDQDVAELGGRIVPVTTKSTGQIPIVQRSDGYDPPPGAPNQHLRR